MRNGCRDRAGTWEVLDQSLVDELARQHHVTGLEALDLRLTPISFAIPDMILRWAGVFMNTCSPKFEGSDVEVQMSGRSSSMWRMRRYRGAEGGALRGQRRVVFVGHVGVPPHPVVRLMRTSLPLSRIRPTTSRKRLGVLRSGCRSPDRARGCAPRQRQRCARRGMACAICFGVTGKSGCRWWLSWLPLTAQVRMTSCAMGISWWARSGYLELAEALRARRLRWDAALRGSRSRARAILPPAGSRRLAR